ncbi:hypothetical protein F5148DRAFT_1313520 [Russula earlei]|uniref:Uncharacterized protein n=1 Tax=Russula earlei TaxID=71964 RepID=A0ACC0U4L2_9AGAM|nr:hypothetical protein F5148DRAFT_1313520 [Russula earlei]
MPGPSLGKTHAHLVSPPGHSGTSPLASSPPERRQWPRREHKFWIHDSPPSNTSQDGTSTSSGGHSTGSEGPEERRVRTVSPYGSFFADEMEFDPPPESRSFSFYRGDGQEQEHITASRLSEIGGAIRPTRARELQFPPGGCPTEARALGPVVAPVAPVLFVSGHHTTYARSYTAVAAPDREAIAGVSETSFSRSWLAENSRQSQPPISWRQGYLDSCSPGPRYDPPQLVATAFPPGRSHSGYDGRQMRGNALGTRKR